MRALAHRQGAAGIRDGARVASRGRRRGSRRQPRLQAATARRSRSASTTPASTTSRTSTSRSRASKFTVITGVSGSGKSHARVRHPLRRRPAPLPRIAQRVRAPVRAARVEARRRCDLRHPADGRDRAAHQPRRPQEHGRDADRDPPLPAPALREARHAVLPRVRRADRAAERRRDRRAPHEGATAASASALLAPLVVEPQGLSTPTSPSGRSAKAVSHLRVDGEFLPTQGLAAPRPLPASTPSSCRWPRSRSSRENEKHAARTRVEPALELGKGVLHVLLRRLGRQRETQIVSR